MHQILVDPDVSGNGLCPIVRKSPVIVVAKLAVLVRGHPGQTRISEHRDKIRNKGQT